MKEFQKIARMRKRFLLNALKSRKEGDVLKFLVISIFITAFWYFTFFLSGRAFLFLDNFPGIGDLIRDRLIYVVFGVISIMLLISTAILSYSKLFKSGETEYLLSLPLAPGAVFAYKSAESIFLSSWASFFLVSPLLVSYGRQYSHHRGCFAVSALAYIPLIIICGITGVLITSAAARHFSLKTLKKAGTGAAAAVSAGFILYLNFASESILFGQESSATVNRLISHTNLFLQPFLPSYWLAEGLLSINRLEMRSSAVHFALLVTTSLVAVIALQGSGRRHYLGCWFAVQDKSAGSKGILTGMADRLSAFLFFIPKSKKAFLVKDIKTFLRDPQQWTQAFLFSGLLLVYILNLGRMPAGMESFYWRRLVYFLNFSALITILAMTSVRFAFPSISIEGKRFWITLLSPVNLRKILMAKFLLAGAILSLLGLVLAVSINYVLGSSLRITIISCAFIVLVSFSLSGLAVGTGALFPDFKEDSVARISSGFGATLTLIVSLAYMILAIAAIAVPVFRRDPFRELPLMAATGGAAAAVSLLCILVPLKLGARHLNNSDF